MIIERRFKPWTCVAPEPGLRPLLSHVWVGSWRKQDVLMAADGFALVVCPVAMEDGDVPGLVSASLLKTARAQAGKAQPVTLKLGDKYVELEDGSLHPRTLRVSGDDRVDIALPFPPLDKILGPREITDTQPAAMGWNIGLMSRVFDALGIVDTHPHLARAGADDTAPWIVGDHREAFALQAPFAVVMPLWTDEQERRSRLQLLHKTFAEPKSSKKAKAA